MNVARQVQALGDIDILKSYLLLVWSEWDHLPSCGFCMMCTLIEEDFGGIGMGCHQEDLIKHLDYILGQLDQGLGYLKQHVPSLHEQEVQKQKSNMENSGGYY